jgi:hypothetical protein
VGQTSDGSFKPIATKRKGAPVDSSVHVRNASDERGTSSSSRRLFAMATTTPTPSQVVAAASVVPVATGPTKSEDMSRLFDLERELYTKLKEVEKRLATDEQSYIDRTLNRDGSVGNLISGWEVLEGKPLDQRKGSERMFSETSETWKTHRKEMERKEAERKKALAAEEERARAAGGFGGAPRPPVGGVGGGPPRPKTHHKVRPAVPPAGGAGPGAGAGAGVGVASASAVGLKRPREGEGGEGPGGVEGGGMAVNPR